jgi:hypothetical protein
MNKDHEMAGNSNDRVVIEELFHGSTLKSRTPIKVKLHKDPVANVHVPINLKLMQTYTEKSIFGAVN